jgi:hypothetical protein
MRSRPKKRDAAGACPECGSVNTRPILYGLPDAEAMEAAERGAIALGGCIVTGDDPRWVCLDCDHRWR